MSQVPSLSYLTSGSGYHGPKNHRHTHIPVGGVFGACGVIEQVESRRVARSIAPPDNVSDGSGGDESNQTPVASEPDDGCDDTETVGGRGRAGRWSEIKCCRMAAFPGEK